MLAAAAHGQKAEPQPGVLDEHPAIQYRFRPTTDRISKLRRRSPPAHDRADPHNGYLRGVLDALGVPVNRSCWCSEDRRPERFTARTPRALYFDQSSSSATCRMHR